MENAGATLRRNKLRNNSCIGDSTSEYEVRGGGIECFKLLEVNIVIIEENEFYNNIMSKFAWDGTVEFQNVHRTALVTKNTMIGNSVSSRAGAYGGPICILTELN